LTVGQLASLAGVSPRTLRHYGELGLFVPARVDPATGYRGYELGQLVELRRVLALRDLGVPLEQIRGALGAPVAELRGMLRLREAELAASVAADQERLRRVGQLLDTIERGDVMQTLDVVVKHIEPFRIAEGSGVAPGYGPENLGAPIWDRLAHVWARLVDVGFPMGLSMNWFEWPDDEGRVRFHTGFPIGDLELAHTDDVKVVELPAVEVAALLHRGPIEGVTSTFEALAGWIEANGHALGNHTREVWLEWVEDEPDKNVLELQIPIERVS
jgi:DNA-binding transcriptional MerR regulator